MFDYQKFENDVVREMGCIFAQWAKEHGDIYIFSLDCAMGMESIGAIANTTRYLAELTEFDSSEYWYYKYCEEEWELSHWFKNISEEMNRCLAENKDSFTAPETCEYTEAFEEHSEKMVECCVNALTRFRRSLGQTHSDVILTFYIRDYFDENGRIEVFKQMNSESAAKEYSEHIEDFS